MVAQPIAEKVHDEEDAFDVEAFRQAARLLARSAVSDALIEALSEYDGSLRDLHAISGLDPATVSKLANGKNLQGGTVASLAQIALALNKTLHISIE